MTTLTISDEARRRDLFRMKSFATGMLLVAAVVYVIASRAESAGAPAWVGFVRAAAEAGMVGGLADWFAVTALFRHPLGLPIPHTALIPTRKDALGRSLGDFVGTNFLAEDVVRHKLRQVDLAGRVGAWLSRREHAERVTGELAATARGALEVMSDDDVRGVMEQAVVQRLVALPVGPPLGRVLGQVVADGAHHGMVDLTVEQAYGWLLANRRAVVDVVAAQAPGWSPRFVDEKVADRIYLEVLRVAGEVRADPRHAMRGVFDRFLAQLALDLQHEPETIARAEKFKAQVLDHPDVRRAMGDLWATVRRMVLEAIDDPHSALRVRAGESLARFGARLVEEDELRVKVNGWVEDAAAHVVTNYRGELTATITETVARWDAAEATGKIELQVGRDLQFIRINGTVVGSLAGLAIHSVGVLVG
ncbi:MAG: DUF445 domain-containing protein [Actinomycetia bacterium]|nr:DUF445 domain-containing protein [Actinomycetes bacterium]